MNDIRILFDHGTVRLGWNVDGSATLLAEGTGMEMLHLIETMLDRGETTIHCQVAATLQQAEFAGALRWLAESHGAEILFQAAGAVKPVLEISPVRKPAIDAH